MFFQLNDDDAQKTFEIYDNKKMYLCFKKKDKF